MSGVRAKPTKCGKYQGWYTDYRGKRIFFFGTRLAVETKRIANRLEDEHRQIALGYRPVPKTSDAAKSRKIEDVVEEYLSWGCASGGRRGLPWAPKHAKKRERILAFWRKRLGLVLLGDVDGCLPRVEKALRELLSSGLSGKTLTHIAGGLGGFCRWALERGMLDEDPLRGLAPFDTSPKSTRRALTAEEGRKLLETIDWGSTVHALRRRMGYALALCSGLRKGELQALRVHHLDVENARLRLEMKWTKNRRDGWQPIPAVLAQALKEEVRYRRRTDPLVHVATDATPPLEADLKHAGIQPRGPGGEITFHCLRHSYISFLHDAGASFEECRLLARHAPRGLTDGVYLHVSETRLRELVEAVGRKVLPVELPVTLRKTGTDDLPVEPLMTPCATGVRSRSEARTEPEKIMPLTFGKQTPSSPLLGTNLKAFFIGDLQRRSSSRRDPSFAFPTPRIPGWVCFISKRRPLPAECWSSLNETIKGTGEGSV